MEVIPGTYLMEVIPGTYLMEVIPGRVVHTKLDIYDLITTTGSILLLVD
jgi:hypothetical protein